MIKKVYIILAVIIISILAMSLLTGCTDEEITGYARHINK